MEAKIDQSALLGDGFNKGFVWINKYSDSKLTDKHGRWARTGYYNGFLISWVNGIIAIENEPHESNRVGECNLFIPYLQFPVSSSQYGSNKHFNTITDAEKWSEEMFLDFKKLINI